MLTHALRKVKLARFGMVSDVQETINGCDAFVIWKTGSNGDSGNIIVMAVMIMVMTSTIK